MPDHPIVFRGQRPRPYRDADGVRWKYWAGEWHRVKTRSIRRAERRVARRLVEIRMQRSGGTDA